MANFSFSIGSVGISNYLLVIARKGTAPTVEAARQNFAGPQPTTRNITFTGLDATVYYFDFRSSSDGVSLGTLLSTYVVNVKEQIILAERRNYITDGGRANDPVSGAMTITDPYLDGKTISGVFREGFRFLLPPTEGPSFKEYDLVSGGGITVTKGSPFSNMEVITIEISYLADQSIPDTSGTAAPFGTVITLTGNTTLGSTHFNKRLRCEGTGGVQMVISLPDLATVPEGTAFYAMQNGGNQIQTRFLPFSGQLFKYFNTTYWNPNYTELSMSPGEYLWFEKRTIGVTAYWEVVQAHEGFLKVGIITTTQFLNHPNILPEDNRLLDGDDYPRLYWFVKNILPSTHKIVDDLVVGGSYSRPVNKQGLFVIHSTLKKFRMPNTQGLSQKALALFGTYNTDGSRLYDYPGGYQADQVGELNGVMTVAAGSTSQTATGTGKMTCGSDTVEPAGASLNILFNQGKVNTVKNIGIIYSRYI